MDMNHNEFEDNDLEPVADTLTVRARGKVLTFHINVWDDMHACLHEICTEADSAAATKDVWYLGPNDKYGWKIHLLDRSCKNRIKLIKRQNDEEAVYLHLQEWVAVVKSAPYADRRIDA